MEVSPWSGAGQHKAEATVLAGSHKTVGSAVLANLAQDAGGNDRVGGINTYLPSKYEPRCEGKTSEQEKAPGSRASGYEEKESVCMGKYLSSLKMTWLWGPWVIAMALGSH